VKLTGRKMDQKEWRRHSVGRAIMEELLGIARDRRVTRVVLHAQVHAIGFYEAFGFRIIGDEFEEAGIPHRRMERTFTT
jgi:predicted GNAT family N-acyltransferase